MKRVRARDLRTGDSIFVWWNSTTREKTDRNKKYRPYDTINAILPYPQFSKNADIMFAIAHFVSGATMSLENGEVYEVLDGPTDYSTPYQGEEK